MKRHETNEGGGGEEFQHLHFKFLPYIQAETKKIPLSFHFLNSLNENTPWFSRG
jgi:hypothetical protein